MKAKLYLTSTKKISNLPDNCVKLLIARKKLPNMTGINWVLDLAPSYKLFWDYKNDIISWDEYVKRYNNELKDNYKILLKIKTFIDNNINVAIICYCDDYTHCHRSLVAEKMKSMGIEIIYG